MLDILVQIPGPIFLVLFTGLSVVCIFIGWLWVNADGSTQYPLPELTRFDPLTLAALRGGRNAVMRTAVFSLLERNLVQFQGKSRNVEIQGMPSDQKPRTGIEKEVYQFVQTPRRSRDLFLNADLRRRIEPHLAAIYRELEQLHLIRTGSDRLWAWLGTLVMFLVIAGVGGTKLILGLTRGRPVLFLVILLIVSFIFLFSVAKPWSLSSRLGCRYLKKLGKQFGWLKETVKQRESSEGIDPAFGVAIFGAGILAGSTFYTSYGEAFARSSSGSSGGCGGGCGGGGCGDGGCGGGGCGGCGGCGG